MYGSGGLSTPAYLGGQTPYQSHDDLNRYNSQANLNSEFISLLPCSDIPLSRLHVTVFFLVPVP